MAGTWNMGGTCPEAGEGGETLPLAVDDREDDNFRGGCGRRARAVHVKQCISTRASLCGWQSCSWGQPAATGLVTSLGFEEEWHVFIP